MELDKDAEVDEETEETRETKEIEETKKTEETKETSTAATENVEEYWNAPGFIFFIESDSQSCYTVINGAYDR